MNSDQWIQALLDAHNERNGLAPERLFVEAPLPYFTPEELLRVDPTPTAALDVMAPMQPTSVTVDESPPQLRQISWKWRSAAAVACMLIVAMAAMIGSTRRLKTEAKSAITQDSAYNQLSSIVHTSDGVTPEQLPIASMDLSPVIIGLSEHPEELTKDDIIFEETVEVTYDLAPSNGPELRTAKIDSESK